ncbi:MAG: queuosine precursor transporter [Deltaproteobacteria bacterium]|nr:queuosine precursor transporter [Deltaproteobacteria bacterium]
MSVKNYKYYDLVMAAFAVVLVCSNLIGPGKLSYFSIFGYQFEYGVGNLFFPFSYVFGDILTEVYGYKRTRKVIWVGFSACAFSAVMSFFVVKTPSIPVDTYQTNLQSALEMVFGNTARVILASLLAFWMGEFANSYVMAKMKIWTKGKLLWSRTIGSTFVGQTVDSFIFYPLAFWGLWETSSLLSAVVLAIVFKVMIEILLTPITYVMVNKLKEYEREDYYDYDTNFTPFSLET